MMRRSRNSWRADTYSPGSSTSLLRVILVKKCCVSHTPWADTRLPRSLKIGLRKPTGATQQAPSARVRRVTRLLTIARPFSAQTSNVFSKVADIVAVMRLLGSDSSASRPDLGTQQILVARNTTFAVFSAQGNHCTVGHQLKVLHAAGAVARRSVTQLSRSLTILI